MTAMNTTNITITTMTPNQITEITDMTAANQDNNVNHDIVTVHRIIQSVSSGEALQQQTEEVLRQTEMLIGMITENNNNNNNATLINHQHEQNQAVIVAAEEIDDTDAEVEIGTEEEESEDFSEEEDDDDTEEEENRIDAMISSTADSLSPIDLMTSAASPSIMTDGSQDVIDNDSPSALSCHCHRATINTAVGNTSQTSNSQQAATVSLTSSPNTSPSHSKALSSNSTPCNRPSCSLLSALSALKRNEIMADVRFIVGQHNGIPDIETAQINASSSLLESGDQDMDMKMNEEKENRGWSLTPSFSSLSWPRSFLAHRVILASRSSVFDRMFNGHLAEAAESREGCLATETAIVVPDITPTAFVALLDYIYLDRIPAADMATHAGPAILHLPSLLYAAIKYDLPRLQGAVRTALQTIAADYVGQLWQALIGMHEEDLAKKYHQYILQHAASFINTPGFLQLPQDLLISIISDDRLQVSEIALFQACWKWVEAEQQQRDDRGEEWMMITESKEDAEEKTINNRDEDKTIRMKRRMQRLILPHIRFPLMSSHDLAVHIAPTALLSDKELNHLFIYISSNNKDILSNLPYNSSPRIGCPSIVSLVYHYDGDEHGLIYWLGTQGYKHTFTNPQFKQECIVTLSSLQHGHPSMITSRSRNCHLWTYNRPNSWLELDIDPQRTGRLLIPSHILLQHGYDRTADALKNWLLEASNNQQKWEPLLIKMAMECFTLPYQQRTFTLPAHINIGYRYFRIRACGKDSSERTEYLCLGGLELYGQLILPPSSQEQQQNKKRSRDQEEESQNHNNQNRAVEAIHPAAVANNAVNDINAAEPIVEVNNNNNNNNNGIEATIPAVAAVPATQQVDRNCWKISRYCTLM